MPFIYTHWSSGNWVWVNNERQFGWRCQCHRKGFVLFEGAKVVVEAGAKIFPDCDWPVNGWLNNSGCGWFCSVNIDWLEGWMTQRENKLWKPSFFIEWKLGRWLTTPQSKVVSPDAPRLIKGGVSMLLNTFTVDGGGAEIRNTRKNNLKNRLIWVQCLSSQRYRITKSRSEGASGNKRLSM